MTHTLPIILTVLIMGVNILTSSEQINQYIVIYFLMRINCDQEAKNE